MCERTQDIVMYREEFNDAGQRDFTFVEIKFNPNIYLQAARLRQPLKSYLWIYPTN